MPTIIIERNYLIQNIRPEKIASLLKDTEKKSRKEKTNDRINELYNQVLQFPRKEMGTSRFVKLVYDTLVAWNMDRRGAELSNFDTFEESLLKNNDVIQSLARLRIEKLKEINNQLQETMEFLYQNLKLVKTNAPFITFSKTMHFFLPNLFVPVDRKYTIQFFRTSIPPSVPERQFRNFCKVFEQFRQFANENRSILEAQIDPNSRWNKNIPKIINNIITAHMKRFEKCEPFRL
ncbi:MAG: hypothetical protein LBK82_05355 [Planctomycetaceae bacterium]|jgi:hypothetical protein|nr:hypothetical protein [Planctomycetaceae bacterium]